MAVLAACMLDRRPATCERRLYPFLLLFLLVLALASLPWSCTACSTPCRTGRRSGCAPAACFAVLLANWPVHILDACSAGPAWRSSLGLDPWQFVTFTFAAVVLAAFVVEMAALPRRRAGRCSGMAWLVWIVAYLGLLPSFLVQLRWPPPPSTAPVTTWLAIFVPKCGDIGAYFTGRLLGRHRMTPVISPKKTWEGSPAA